jgi:RHS repeat-associated protein
MTYDAEGHMNPTSGTTYTYDGDGRRVQKSDGTIYWIDDNLRPISVGTASGAITKDYIFMGSKRIAFVSISTGNPYYYLSDNLGSTGVISSGDGKSVQWEADYFPFGNIRQILTNMVSNNYDFTGYENDSDTGYNYANARFEGGRWGRFLSPDSYLGSMDMTNPQSLNRYSYVLNNASNFIDPSGLIDDTCNDDDEDGCVNANELLPADGSLADGSPDGSNLVPCDANAPSGLQCLKVVVGSVPLNSNGPTEGDFDGLNNPILHFDVGSGGGGGASGTPKVNCAANARSFVAAHLHDAQTLASSLGNGVTPAEVLSVSANETTYGSNESFARFGNFFGLHGNGPAGTYYTKSNHTAVMMFPVDNGFLLSGQVFVQHVGPFMQPGIGTNPLAFFTSLNHHGYATGDSTYPHQMADPKTGVLAHINACLGAML